MIITNLFTYWINIWWIFFLVSNYNKDIECGPNELCDMGPAQCEEGKCPMRPRCQPGELNLLIANKYNYSVLSQHQKIIWIALDSLSYNTYNARMSINYKYDRLDCVRFTLQQWWTILIFKSSTIILWYPEKSGFCLPCTIKES